MSQPPLSATDVVGATLRTYRDHAGAIVPAAVLVYAVEALAALLFQGALAFLAAIVSLVVGVFFQGMVVALVRDVQDGRLDHSVGELFRSIAPVFWALLGLAIVLGVAVGIGFVLLIVPGLILLTIWAVAVPVCVLERPGVFSSLGRSRELVRGHGGSVFAVIVLTVVLVFVIGIVVGAVASSLPDWAEAAVGWLVNVVFAPVAALASSVLYFALLRVKGEGLPPEPAPAGGDAGDSPLF